MAFNNVQLARVVKRLQEAAGYMELGLPQKTLDRLEDLGDLGPLEAEVELLRGQAFRVQHRFEDAATAFKAAARKFPSPQDRSAWLALSLCYRDAGDTMRAIQSLAHARGAMPSKRKRHMG